MRIKPSPLIGTVKAPPSKSMTHRVLITAALAEGKSLVRSPLMSQDTYATVEVLRKLGADITEHAEGLSVKGGKPRQPDSALNCNESGTTLRIMTGVASTLDAPVTLSGAPSLIKRPNKQLLDSLEQLGVKTQSSEGYPPITVRGPIKGGKTTIRGDVSSQFISAILLAAPYAENPVEVELSTVLESKPYVEITIDAMRKAGVTPHHNEDLTNINVPLGRYHPRDSTVEGDWSSAAYLLAAGTLAGKVHVDNLDTESKQADREILRILNEMGAYLKQTGYRVTTEHSELSPIEANLSDCPDLFPMVACLCAVSEGTSKLTGLARLRIKESDRLEAVRKGLTDMGISITVGDSTVTIKGGTPKGATINPYNDHRIAMSFAILAQTAIGETTIQSPECVNKSYPGFWMDLKKLGADLA